MAGVEDIDYEVEYLVDKRVTEKGITEYLVRWKGFNSEWDTWEPENNLDNCKNIIKKFNKSIEPPKNSLTVTKAKHATTSGNKTVEGATEKDRYQAKGAKTMQRRSRPVKRAPVKAVNVKGQRKVKVLTNKGKSTVGKNWKLKKELIPIDDEITFAIIKDLQKDTKQKGNKITESEREALQFANMAEIFKAVLAKSNEVETSQRKSDKDKKKHGSEKVKKNRLPVRRTRSADPKLRARNSDKNRSLNAGTKESQATSLRFIRKSSKLEDGSKSKRQSQSKETAAEMASGKNVKKRSPKSDKGDGQTVNRKTTSKIDELFNHLMEQVRAATPPTKLSKHTVVSVKNVLKSGKAKVPSPKSSPVKLNKAAGSQTNETKQVNKDLKSKKEKQPNVQIIRVDLPKTSVHVDSKVKENTKSVKEKTTKVVKEKSKIKPVAGQKRKASGNVTIETDDESNSDDGVLYSLSDMEDSESTPSKSPEDERKLLKKKSASTTTCVVEKQNKDGVKLKNKKVAKLVKSQLESIDEKPEKPKKMRLLDSLTKPVVVKPVRPVSPTPLFTAVKTAAVVPTTSNSRRNNRAPGGIPMYQYVIQPSAAIPISPTSMSYKMLLDNLPHQLHPKKNKNKTDSGEEDVERRISVRASECAFKYKEIIVKKCQKYTQIWLYTHTKMKNSLNPQVILELQSALNAAKYDDSNLVMLSGLDNVFCSGIDLQFLLSGDRKVAARQMVDALRDFTKTLITFPKLIVAVVTGPAIGLGMTMLPLCDVVYASDKATFFLPYAQLAQTPEGCASYTFPQALGMAMANELMIGGRKITAIEACQLGLVSQVYWPTSMMQEVIPRIQNMAQSSGKVLETTKLLIRSHQRTKLDLTNESETNLLLERWSSTECQKAITEFLNDETNYTL